MGSDNRDRALWEMQQRAPQPDRVAYCTNCAFWRKLLLKYLAHVGDQEGTSFMSSVPHSISSQGGKRFTPTEVEAILKLDEEAEPPGE